jgi:hypothetical protein
MQVIQGQKSISQVQTAELILLVVEGACVVIIAVSYVMRLLSTISMHRQALFSVFLAIPHGYLRTLASKSVSIGDDDEEDEGTWCCCKPESVFMPACLCTWLHLNGYWPVVISAPLGRHFVALLPVSLLGIQCCRNQTILLAAVVCLVSSADDKVMQAAEAKRQKKKKQDAEDDAREEGEMSMAGRGPGTDAGGPPTASRRNRKASFALEGGDATVVVNAAHGAAASFTKGSKVCERLLGVQQVYGPCARSRSVHCRSSCSFPSPSAASVHMQLQQAITPADVSFYAAKDATITFLLLVCCVLLRNAVPTATHPAPGWPR